MKKLEFLNGPYILKNPNGEPWLDSDFLYYVSSHNNIYIFFQSTLLLIFHNISVILSVHKLYTDFFCFETDRRLTTEGAG